MRAIVNPDELRIVKDLDRQERLHFIKDTEEIFSGIVATRLGGHTPGQLMVQVSADCGRIVLASDSMHYYEELEARPGIQAVRRLPCRRSRGAFIFDSSLGTVSRLSELAFTRSDDTNSRIVRNVP